MTLYRNFVVMSEIVEKRVEFLLSHPNVQNILANGIFDVVIVEIFGDEALFGEFRIVSFNQIVTTFTSVLYCV